MKNPEIVLAILGGSCVVGASLYAGLRASHPGAPAAPVASTALTAPTALTTPAAPRPTAPEPAAAVADPRALAAAVAAAIDSLRPQLVSECLAPSVARQKDPASVPYVWNGTIGPDGVPLSSGLSEDRVLNRADVTPCLQRKLMTLRLPATAGQGWVEVPFSLP